MKRLWERIAGVAWSPNLLLLASAVFLIRFGEGILGGARANFFVDTLGLNADHVLLLEGVRELPGLALMFIAATMTRLPLARRAAVALLVMGLGVLSYALVGSFTALLMVAVVDSLGNHVWMPLSPALGMSLSTRETSGRVLGGLASVGSLAGIVGIGAIALVSRLFGALSLRAYYVAGGALVLCTAFMLTRLPADVGTTRARQPRLLLKGRYWRFFTLTFLQGSHKQVLATFGTLILVERYGLQVWEISLILMASSIVNLFAAPYVGRLVDRVGERATLSTSYAGLALCCLAFALLRSPLLLGAIIIVIRLLQIVGMGLNTYVNRIAPREELTPTLSAGISVNHVTSVAMPFLNGLLLPLIGYNGVFAITGSLLVLSIPFALGLRTEPIAVAEAQPAAAK